MRVTKKTIQIKSNGPQQIKSNGYFMDVTYHIHTHFHKFTGKNIPIIVKVKQKYTKFSGRTRVESIKQI